jgi:hypothetical protein
MLAAYAASTRIVRVRPVYSVGRSAGLSVAQLEEHGFAKPEAQVRILPHPHYPRKRVVNA